MSEASDRLLEFAFAEQRRAPLTYLTLSVGRNPCCRCSTVHLENEFVGSGYCSLACLLADRDGPDKERSAYATQMMAALLRRELGVNNPGGPSHG